MKDFNNIEADPIPEGLEFNESYMQDAFALYDAEKRKRKRRLLIWWITSALGFSSVLLIGIFFFTREEISGHSGKKAPADKEVFVQKSPVGPNSSNAHQDSLDKANAGGKKSHLMQQISVHSQKGITDASIARSGYNSRNSSRSKLKAGRKSKLTNSTEKNRNTGNSTGENIPENTLSIQNRDNSSSLQDSIPEKTTEQHATSEAVKAEPKPVAEPIDLPSRPAVLAFADNPVSALPAFNQSPTPLTTETDVRKNHVFLNLGVNTLFGMKELKNKATFRESIGVSYTCQISPKFTIGAGIAYHSISRISYKRKIGDTTNSDKTTTILNKTTLNYISFSPQVQYQLWPNHLLTAGFGIEYLLVDPGERYEISNYTQETPKRTNSKLYYSTFNRFNFSVSLGYTYQFSRFMAVHASYHYGFTDITRNTDFNKTFDRNSRLQIGLNIKLY